MSKNTYFSPHELLVNANVPFGFRKKLSNMTEAIIAGQFHSLVAVENHVIDLGVFAVRWSHLTELRTVKTDKVPHNQD